MTNFRVVAHLGMSDGEWTESKKANLDEIQSNPSMRRDYLLTTKGLSPVHFNCFEGDGLGPFLV
jgi:hypothetical protein